MDVSARAPVAYQYREFYNDPDDWGWGLWKPCLESEVEFLRKGKYVEVRELYTQDEKCLCYHQRDPDCAFHGHFDVTTVRDEHDELIAGLYNHHETMARELEVLIHQLLNREAFIHPELRWPVRCLIEDDRSLLKAFIMKHLPHLLENQNVTTE